MRPLRERLLIAMWLLSALWMVPVTVAMTWEILTSRQHTSDQWASLAFVALGTFACALLQYVVVGYADPRSLFGRTRK